jgi:DNA topoisomerase-1
VNQGKVNATLPKTLKPEEITLEQALELIVAKGGATPKKSSSRTAAAKKPAAKKAATTKKPAAKAKTAAKTAAKPKAASKKTKAENPA